MLAKSGRGCHRLVAPCRCVDHVANRLGHGFPDEEATRHMYRQFAQADIDQRHVLADLPASPTETAAEIARRIQAGRLRYT